MGDPYQIHTDIHLIYFLAFQLLYVCLKMLKDVNAD